MYTTEKMEFLRDIIKAQGVDMHFIDDKMENAYTFDNGFRGRLYEDYDYSIIGRWITDSCTSEYTIINAHDAFDVTYTIMKAARYEERTYYISIGPFLPGESRPDAVRVADRLGLDLYQVRMLDDLYSALPLQRNISYLMYRFLRSVSPEGEFMIVHREMSAGETEGLFKNRTRLGEREIPFKTIEKKYDAEDRLLKAIEKGSVSEARGVLEEFGNFHISSRIDDPITDARNWAITLNVLFRKAVQNAQVHPAHIDSVSGSFVKQIYTADSIKSLGIIVDDMIRKYCHLVLNFSLAGYSQIIRDVVNYIEFNLQEDLGLNALSRQFCVNASHLSGKFRRETGQTLTEYVNRRRVEKAMSLLLTTGLPVNEVAEAVGVLDENYFSRMFKKQVGMTPSQYRKDIKQV